MKESEKNGRIAFENTEMIRAGSKAALLFLRDKQRREAFCASAVLAQTDVSKTPPGEQREPEMRSISGLLISLGRPGNQGKESAHMKSDDVAMLREVQKKSSTTLKAIQAISEYVDNADMSRMLFGQSKIIENIRNRAVESLMEGGEEVRQESIVSQTLVSSAIHMNTMLNTSTSHIAELMIKNHQKGVTGMWRAMNRYDTATDRSVELAQELADFEESCIERMRPYL